MNAALLLQTLIDGLILGGVFSLSAVGFSLIFGVLGVVNLAHGVFILGGAYLGLWLKGALGLDPLASIPVVFVAMFAIGAALQRTLVSTSIRRGSLMTSLLITFGASLILRDVLIVAFGPDIQSLSSTWLLRTFHIGSVVVDGARATGLIASLVLLGVLALALNAMKVGRAIRATAQNLVAARLYGVEPRHLYAMTFGIGIGLAGAAGGLYGTVSQINPYIGATLTAKSFAIAIIGGLDNPLATK